MSLDSIKNNIFFYFLSLSNSFNYISYFQFILLYLFETENLTLLESIKIYTFFIIYDLIRNIFINPIQKMALCIGLNKKISIDLFILNIISIFLSYLFYKFRNKSFLLNIIIIFRILFSLTNTTNIFRTKIIENLFEKKVSKKVIKIDIFDVCEKINNFLIFVIFFFFIDSLNKFYLYFFFTSIFNLFFFIIYLLMFKCYDEKINELYEEDELNEIKNTPKNFKNKKEFKTKKINRLQNKKNAYILKDINSSSNSHNKQHVFHNKYRKTSSEIIVNIVKNTINNNENKNNNDIENNEIILSTNNKQKNAHKELSNAGKIKNNTETENINSKVQYNEKDLDIMNNTPITSTNRSLNDHLSKNLSLMEEKNYNILSKKKGWIFIIFILIPSKFLKYLFLFMLFIKTNILKNAFKIRIHYYFYLGYFLLNILINPINKKIFFSVIKTKNGKKNLYIVLIIFSIPAYIGYIYLLLDNSLNKEIYKLEKYILFFTLNFILKECIYFLLSIYSINIITFGLSKVISKKMKEISNILACFLFLGYNILLLLIKNDSITYKIINYILYYILPLIFMILFFIYSINIT